MVSPTGRSATPALSAIVLAAGEGTRMRSRRPKPLHLLCGRAMLLYVLDALADCDTHRAVVVVGHGAERVTKKLQDSAPTEALDFVEQPEQRGTGDAVRVALTAFPDVEIDGDGDVIVLPGDTPLLRPTTIAALVAHHRATRAACTVLTATMDDPSGYGRVVRAADGSVRRIVEHADATPDALAITEVNTSIYCVRLAELAPALRRLEPQNAQGEYYLTDVVEVLADAGYLVTAHAADDPAETQGVNDRHQLAAAEAELRRRTNDRLMREGVTMVDPATTYVDTTVTVAGDVTLFPGTILAGSCSVGPGSEIGPDTRLVDCAVGAEATISYTSATQATVGDGAVVGPYAVLAPGAEVPPGARTGSFVTLGGHPSDG
jgi:bifunctional UDP-N-acetylglucosamine pyrophosphorylase/glucosamine-1-phosphate N-acetyltransferase